MTPARRALLALPLAAPCVPSFAGAQLEEPLADSVRSALSAAIAAAAPPRPAFDKIEERVAFLRWHDPNNWPLLRDALKQMGRSDLIGNGKHHLIPTYQPTTDGSYTSARRKNSTPARPSRGTLLTQHTGLPPRASGAARKKKPGTP